ncbi:MAG: protein kinase [Bryobacteraceae bacterium]
MQQIGRYQIIERLGRGAMGVVYKARDPRIGRTVAAKSIRLAEISDISELKKLRDRLEREARSAGALSHRNIVTIYDILEEEKLVHLFMEYVNGPSLEKMLSENALPEKDVLIDFFRQIASALDYAHKIGIVHRDVKPSNLLVHYEHATGERIAKVTDFGVAKFMSQQMTQAGSMMGTPNYMAPEQIEGSPITGQADQFALAAVVYEVLCGEKAFVADYVPTLFFRIVKEEPKAADVVNTSLSPAINAVLQRALAKKPEERFESCTAFINALTEALDAHPQWMPPYRMGAVELPRPETEIASPLAHAAAASEVVREGETRKRQQPMPETQLALPRPRIDPQPPSQPVPPPSEPVPPTQPEAATEETRQQPVILPYDLPYRLPELRRTRKERDEEEPEGLPLWRKVAIAALLLVMAAIAAAVYRNFTGAGESQVIGSHSAPSSGSNATTPVPSTEGQPEGQSSAPAPESAPPVATPGANSQGSTPGGASSSPAENLSKAPASEPVPLHPKESTTPLPGISRPNPPTAAAVPVQFSSEPSRAQVVVDKDEAKSCATPCSIALMPGRHTLTIRAPNYGVAQRIIQVPEQHDVFVPLSQNIAIVELDSVPGGSTVYIDGRLEGQTPATLKLAPGPHQVRLISGSRSLQQTIQVSAESLQSFVFRWQ